ncbi:MAG: 50S ribosomal protein L22 [Actinobacteria bacterium]|nr:50S ribosomal protein L22 [Actinomycetota bacterium]
MATRVVSDEQAAMASARFIRMSPTKARRVIDLIRDRHVDDARRVLRFTQRGASAPILKVLNSAIANAEHNRGLAADELVVVRAWADEGPTLRRYRPRALGRATRIRKRTCHISVVVGRPDEAIEEARGGEQETKRRARTEPATASEPGTEVTEGTAAKKTTAKKTTAKKTTAKKTTAKKTTAKKTTRKKKSEGSED